MKVEGVKKWHLILSSVLYIILIISALVSYANPYQFIAILTSSILFLLGLLFLVYYFAKKEDRSSKVLSMLNIIASVFFWIVVWDIPNFFARTVLYPIETYVTLIVYLVFLLFNFYLCWSREKSETLKKKK